MARGPSSISGTQKHKLGKNSRARGGRAREEGRFWDGACVGSENRGIAAPAFICSGQTMLLDIWEEGSKADVPRGPSVTATVQGGCQAGRTPAQLLCCLLSDVPWPLKHEQAVQEREVNVPAEGLADWGVPLRLRGEPESGTGETGEQREGGKNKLSSKNSGPRRNTRPGLGALDSQPRVH